MRSSRARASFALNGQQGEAMTSPTVSPWIRDSDQEVAPMSTLEDRAAEAAKCVYQMPQRVGGDWAYACRGRITDEFADDAEAVAACMRWIARCEAAAP